jgi:hypothetical protein
MSTEFDEFRLDLEATMEDELKRGWEQLEEGLSKAMGKLSDAIQRAGAEMPDAMKSINEEYLRVQEVLDRAVDKLRK